MGKRIATRQAIRRAHVTLHKTMSSICVHKFKAQCTALLNFNMYKVCLHNSIIVLFGVVLWRVKANCYLRVDGGDDEFYLAFLH